MEEAAVLQRQQLFGNTQEEAVVSSPGCLSILATGQTEIGISRLTDTGMVFAVCRHMKFGSRMPVPGRACITANACRCGIMKQAAKIAETSSAAERFSSATISVSGMALREEILVNSTFDLQKYLSDGVEQIVAASLKAALCDPREAAFIIKFAAAARKASRIRAAAEKAGEHIPAFLIASITSRCNLHCAGCYSRCNHATTDSTPSEQLTAGEWLGIFREAAELGISYIILAGGEPMMRPDVIHAAAGVGNIMFPIFTNGTHIGEEEQKLFYKYRNLLPVISFEGNEEQTDSRRGRGIYRQLMALMDAFHDKGVPFGVSVTVTSQNIMHIAAGDYIKDLGARGCRLAVFVEYVPTSNTDRHLAPGEKERTLLEEAVTRQQQKNEEMIFLSFPGDEKASGGCIAAGRGFFHINSHGGAEPCPFSPYSDTNVRNTSLRTALKSPLFRALHTEGLLLDDHEGGCVLYEKKDQVQALLASAGRL